MSIKIQKDFVFESAIHFEGSFLINFYELTLHMTVDTDDMREQNIALERINYFLANHIENHIWVSSEEKKAIEAYQKANISVLEIPEEPFDQIVGMILLLKINAITEGKISVTNIIFGSKLTNNIKFDTSVEEAEALFAGKFWWNTSSPSTVARHINKKEKVVKLVYEDNWNEFGLSWKAPANC
jgi:hypothetical protein